MHAIPFILLLGVLGSFAADDAPLLRPDASSLIRAPIYPRSHPARTHQFGLDGSNVHNTSLLNYLTTQYHIELGIGTPRQNFTLVVDTGSSDLWVPCAECPISACSNSRFAPDKSTTFKTLNQPFSVVYGSGNVSRGYYVMDSVHVAGLTVPNQQFGLAAMTHGIITVNGKSDSELARNTLDNDGVLGLGYPALTGAAALNHTPYNSLVFNMVSQGLISSPEFSIYMINNVSEHWDAEIIFGGVDQRKFLGNISYVPVVPAIDGQMNYKYWSVYGQGFRVRQPNGSTPDFRFNAPKEFILNTGSSLTYVPTELAEALVNAVVGPGNFHYDPQNGVYVIDCQEAYKNKAVLEIHLPPSDQIVDHPIKLTMRGSTLWISTEILPLEQSNHCVFAIAPSGEPSTNSTLRRDKYILGLSVLRGAYLAFDIGQNRVGFAMAIGSETIVEGLPIHRNHAPFAHHSSFVVSTVGILCTLAMVLF